MSRTEILLPFDAVKTRAKELGVFIPEQLHRIPPDIANVESTEDIIALNDELRGRISVVNQLILQKQMRLQFTILMS